MSRINITCDTCGLVHDVRRTPEIPKTVFSMGCNWCPACADRAEDYYEEWYNYNDDGESKVTIEPDPRQTNLFPIYPDERDYTEKKKEESKIKI
jgi:hypothetical protein